MILLLMVSTAVMNLANLRLGMGTADPNDPCTGASGLFELWCDFAGQYTLLTGPTGWPFIPVVQQIVGFLNRLNP